MIRPVLATALAVQLLPLPIAAQSVEGLAAAFSERVAYDGEPGEEFRSVRFEVTADCDASIIVVIEEGGSLISASLSGSLAQVDVTTLNARGTGQGAELEFEVRDPGQGWTFRAEVPAGDEFFEFIQGQVAAGEIAGTCTAESCFVEDDFGDPSIPIPGVAEADHPSLVADFQTLIAACITAPGN